MLRPPFATSTLSHEYKTEKQRKKDALILIVTLFCILGIFIYFDIGDVMAEWIEEHEQFEFDEILITLSTRSIAFAWFAYRRWKEYSSELINRASVNQLLTQEIDERKKAEAKLESNQINLQNIIDEATDELKTQSEDLKQALVEMHGGSINVVSEKGKGATFTVRIPIAGADQTALLPSKAA